jgi:dipeptidyl aminopeptidase/acylaminoacyl peptidase
MNKIMDNDRRSTCIIAKSIILKEEILNHKDLKNSYLCLDRQLDDNELQPYYRNYTKLFDNEIIYSDSVWSSYGIHNNVKRVYLFEIPNKTLSVYEHIGMSKELIEASYYQNGKDFLKSIIPKNLKVSFEKSNIKETSTVTMMFNNRRGKVIDHNINLVQSCCDIFTSKEDRLMQQKLIIEWLSRKINNGLQRNKLTNDIDVTVLTLKYNYNGNKIDIYEVHFGLPYNMTVEIFDVIKNKNFSFI